MLGSTEPQTTPAVRKIQPLAKPPGRAFLQSLSSSDLRLLKRRLIEPVECVFDETFHETDAERRYTAPLTPRVSSEAGDNDTSASAKARNDDSGIDLLAAASPSMTGADEQKMFLRLNYCRYRVMLIMREFHDKRLTAEATRELLHWEGRVSELRGEIVRANVPLVLAMAKRTRITGVDYSDLISEGNLALLRSVDKFDCRRGFKFSTYACRAILKSFSRVAARTSRYRGYFPTEFDPTLEKSDYTEQRRTGVETECVNELKAILGSNRARLNEIEVRVIRARFALDEVETEDGFPKAKTLEQVGEMIGVTKERVRQIQNKALSKLRSVLEDGILAAR